MTKQIIEDKDKNKVAVNITMSYEEYLYYEDVIEDLMHYKDDISALKDMKESTERYSLKDIKKLID